MHTIIHIGQHKTGTTSIQNYLRDCSDTFARQGLYVPRGLAGHNHPSHYILNVYALSKDRYSSKKEEIIKERGAGYVLQLEEFLKRDIEQVYAAARRERCSQVIWSNEGLYLLNSVEEYKRLRSLFLEHSEEVEVVCCFRDPASYKESYIQQLKKQGIQTSDHPYSYRYVGPDSWLFDYPRKKELLSHVFGKCTYFDYDPSDNVAKFLEVLNLNGTATTEYRFNRSANFRGNALQRIKRLFSSKNL